ncbi:hypothetical protein, partial [Klebsiella oxytoca]
PLLIWWTPLCRMLQIMTRRFTLYAYKESGLTVSLLIQRKPSSEMAGVFASGFGLKYGADECLSTTLYPKESGLTVSFNFSANPCQQWRGFLLLASG